MNSPRSDAPDLQDRLLAEAVRAAERDGAALLDAPEAESAARARGGDFEQRVVHRASAMPIGAPLRDALGAVHRATIWIVIAGVAFALLTGAGAAKAALVETPGGSVNVFWVLLALLGVQTLLLGVWCIVMLARPRSGQVSPLGGALLGAGRWVARRTNRSPAQLAAVHAVGTTIARGTIGRWTLSAVSHAMWVAANTGCIVLLVVLLSTREYRFSWETTILSADTYERLTQTLGVVPGALGFPSPTPEQVTATEAVRASGDEGAARAWSGFLIGAIVTYGLGPRVLLLLLCAYRQRVAQRRFRLDLTAPGYERLRPRLMPEAETIGVISPDDGEPAPPVARATAMAATPAGPPVLIGHEIQAPAGGWPPPARGVEWIDLGIIDGRDERRRVSERLSTMDPPARMTIIVCDLRTTPDRGVGTTIDHLATSARGPVGLVLTGGQALRGRADLDGVAQRVRDWRTLATSRGIDDARVIEVDLDHPTDRSLGRVAELAGGASNPAQGSARSAVRHLETAFDVIASRAATWRGAPSVSEQSELHRKIASVYHDRAATLPQLFGLPGDFSLTDAESLKDGARRFVDLLPARLRSSPKWIAAGAVSGALGCIAVGALVAPAALAALPAWAMSGAGLAGIVQFARGGAAGNEASTTTDADADDVVDYAGAVRAATLFALLLELQGTDEVTITRTLDRTLPASGEADLGGPETVAPWLAEVRHRFDLAHASGHEGATEFGAPGGGA